ncbi:hypothetical protein CONPUDRAFT_160573 [Coniophora puteana RWD-64-598 SS2]|uniref:Uncharacterized protein n=1 Tax=Coniophora puteana (strain RWD-64-598) TaxID=741705 RepID=R7SFQ8_CONPW|nr:uncharacterized protein CONPUDRAFT_160573 [Coniophora puteana RWD-64-598 SS2]EIW73924.1 hypothetical protein CONPUDRAFT_160573 [Coniophora puteana RWD-64-598 SS2]
MSASSSAQAATSNAAASSVIPANAEPLPSWWPTRFMDKDDDDQRQNFLDIVELRILDLYDYLNVPEVDRPRFEHNWRVEWGNLNPILCRLFNQISKNGAKGNFKNMKHARVNFRPPKKRNEIGDKWWATGTTLNDPIPPQPKTRSSDKKSKTTPSTSSSASKPAPTTTSHPAPTTSHPAPTAPNNPSTSSAAPAPARPTTAPRPPLQRNPQLAPLTMRAELPNADVEEEEESPTPRRPRVMLTLPRIPSTPPEDDGRPAGKTRAPAPPASSAVPIQAPAPTSAGAATSTSTNQAAPSGSARAARDGIPAFDQYRVPHRSLFRTDWNRQGISGFNVSVPTSDQEAFDVYIQRVTDHLGRIHDALVRREVLINNALVDLDDSVALMREELGAFKNEMREQLAEIKLKGSEEESRMAVDPAL